MMLSLMGLVEIMFTMTMEDLSIDSRLTMIPAELEHDGYIVYCY